MGPPRPRPTAVYNVRLAEPAGEAAAAGEPAVALLENGRVAAVRPWKGGAREPELGEGWLKIDGGGLWLLPGWVDLQVNDLEWLAKGFRPPAEHRERILEVARRQAARGVTGFILATLAAPEEEILSYLEGMALVLKGRDQDASAGGEAFLGGLVEGTFMNPAFHGAHNPAHVRPPDPALLDRFLSTGAVRLVNIAPEMSLEATALIAAAARRGAVVGVGHAKPHAERVREAVRAGLKYVIHWGNGPTGSSLKSFAGGGLLEEALRNDDLIVTLIADGIHLDPRLVRDVIARKGWERVIAVSDAGFAAGNPSGEFEVFGVRGRVSGDGRYLEVVPARPGPPPHPHSSDFAPLFGSAADMRRIFETCLNLLTVEMEGIYCRRHEAMELPEALRAACRLCAGNPARLLEEEGRGGFEPGARADAVLVGVQGRRGSYRVEVREVWLGGYGQPSLSGVRS
ncbi:MAG: hypothetical protein HY717_00370 [Planctomycetes bacterium]|nr:hypothetical protein [Planctomycetota bacterium]